MQRLQSIQALRGAAALSVMVFHLCLKVDHLTGTDLYAHTYLLQRGVDVFFVISGFVMAHSVRGLNGPGDAAGFMVRRYWRIAPLLYSLTLAGVALAVSQRIGADPARIVNSVTVLPLMQSPFKYQYVLPQAWTLGFEMAFYLMVAAVVALRVPRRLTVLAIACCFAAVVNIRMVEFAVGVGAYGLWTRGKVRFPARVPGWSRALGDMSYSLYLSHSLTLAILAPVLVPFGIMPMIVALFISSLAIGWLTYKLVEEPLQRIRFDQDRGKGATGGVKLAM